MHMLAVAWLVCVATTNAAQAQNSLTLGGASVVAGEQGVVIEVRASTTSPITFLDADIVFDQALCGRIESQSTTSAAEDRNPIALFDGVRCPGDGRASIIALDLSATAGTVSIPAGEGPIARWTFNVRGDAVGGNFPLTLRVNDARNGTLAVPLTVAAQGAVRIEAPIPTGTPTVNTPVVTPPTATRTIAVPTPEATLTVTPIHTPTPESTAAVTDTPTTPTAPCVGDCNRNGAVAINELITGVNIALGSSTTAQCAAFDASGDGSVGITELIRGVNNALNGCAP